MFDVFILCLREGLEAFLIVHITLSCLRTLNRSALFSAVYSGALSGVIISILIGTWLSQYIVTPLWEGVMAIVAALLVTSMLLYMKKVGRLLKQKINLHVQKILDDQSGIFAWLGMFIFITLMVAREGMEIAFILVSLVKQVNLLPMFLGGCLGVWVAISIGMLWTKYSSRIHLPLFFQVTSIFLWIFTVELYLYAFHEFCEGGLVPLIDNVYWHNLTEKYGPEGQYGAFITYALVLVPLVWVVKSMLVQRSAKV